LQPPAGLLENAGVAFGPTLLIAEIWLGEWPKLCGKLPTRMRRLVQRDWGSMGFCGERFKRNGKKNCIAIFVGLVTKIEQATSW
jgi:hypothetical protein